MKKTLLVGVGLIALGLSGSAISGSANEIQNTGFSILKLIFTITTLVGFFTAGAGLLGFMKHTAQPTVYTIKYCVTTLLVGSCLMIPGGMYSVVHTTVVDTNYQYNRAALYDGKLISESKGDLSKSVIGKYLSNEAWAVILTFLTVVGAYFFVKGIYLFKEVAAASPGQDVGVSKPLTHIVGGVACMNISWAMCLLGGAISVSMFCS